MRSKDCTSGWVIAGTASEGLVHSPHVAAATRARHEVDDGGQGPFFGGRADPGRLTRLVDDEGSHAQGVEFAAHEGVVGLAGRADDRLPTEVEARIDEDRAARAPVEGFEKLAEAAVALRVDGLDASGAIHVGYCRKPGARDVQFLDSARTSCFIV